MAISLEHQQGRKKKGKLRAVIGFWNECQVFALVSEAGLCLAKVFFSSVTCILR